MVREDIVRGLEGAMSKGETLEQAMYSFYNAGYNKSEVEEAARALSIHISQRESQIPTKLQLPNPVEKKIFSPENANPIKTQNVPVAPKQTLQSVVQVQQKQITEKSEVVQDASAYVQKNKISTRTMMIAILSTMLAILFGALISIFVFRDAIIGFFNASF